jgi:hypothetical protein
VNIETNASLIFLVPLFGINLSSFGSLTTIVKT